MHIVARAMIAAAALSSCQGRPASTPDVPPPANATATCDAARVTRLEGVFSMIHGDPPGESGQPAAQYMLSMMNGKTVSLEVTAEQLEAYQGGRALDGQRVVVQAEVNADRPRARVCSIVKA